MKPNMNFLDTILRVMIGPIFGAICGVMGWWIGVLTIYPIVTALTAWDPIYELLGYYTTEHNPYIKEETKKKAVGAKADGERVEYKLTA